MKYTLVVYILFFSSCVGTSRKDMEVLVEEWMHKEIIFPNNIIFTIQGRDTIEFSNLNGFKIINYVDSTGCTLCKMRLTNWAHFMREVDSVSTDSVQFLFFFSPKNERDLRYALKVDHFKYPVCIDQLDTLNKLNHFPDDTRFQTFLLDGNNQVVAIGNPVNSEKIKYIYLNILSGKKSIASRKQLQTEVIVSETLIDIGEFSSEKVQYCTFTLQNTGKDLLVIDDVNTSCGCTSVEFSKEPVEPGGSLDMVVTYKADHPEHFNKTITVYCNASTSPLQLKIIGNAK